MGRASRIWRCDPDRSHVRDSEEPECLDPRHLECHPKARWQLQTAKARFSELFRRARSEGPQLITRRDKEGNVNRALVRITLICHMLPLISIRTRAPKNLRLRRW